MFVLPLLFALVKSQQVRPDIASHPNWRLLDRGEDCGLSSSNRIIGGHNARLGQYPWLAQLGYAVFPDPNNIHVDVYNCGGTIINDKYILTAAHCSPKFMAGVTPDMGVEMVQVRLGEHNVKTDPDCEDGVCAPSVQNINIEHYVCHNSYSNVSKHDDICLVRLVKPIQFNRYVQPICLPTYENEKRKKLDRSILEVAGWGVKDIKTGEYSTILQTLKVPFISLHLCRLAYTGRAELTEKQLCAGGVVGKDSCSGDSGGPLMAALSLNGPPRYFLEGIVSYGPEKCSVKRIPGIYTNVSAYMKWILDNIRK